MAHHERKIRSHDVIFKKGSDRQQVEVEEADDSDRTTISTSDSARRNRRPKRPDEGVGDDQDQPGRGFVYDLIDGRRSVNEIVDRSKYHEFDTSEGGVRASGSGLIEEAKEVVLDRQRDVAPGCRVVHLARGTDDPRRSPPLLMSDVVG